MRVRFTPGARRQFFEALARIRKGDPAAARSFRNRAEVRLRHLREEPESGRRLPEFPDLPHREVVVSPYRFLCRPDRASMWVLGVCYSPDEPPETESPS